MKIQLFLDIAEKEKIGKHLESIKTCISPDNKFIEFKDVIIRYNFSKLDEVNFKKVNAVVDYLNLKSLYKEKNASEFLSAIDLFIYTYLGNFSNEKPFDVGDKVRIIESGNVVYNGSVTAIISEIFRQKENGVFLYNYKANGVGQYKGFEFKIKNTADAFLDRTVDEINVFDN